MDSASFQNQVQGGFYEPTDHCYYRLRSRNNQ